MTRQEENIIRALPDSDRQRLSSFILDSSARSAVVGVGLGCADCDDREGVICEMKLSMM